MTNFVSKALLLAEPCEHQFCSDQVI